MADVPSHIYEKVMRAIDFISQGETPTKACDDAGTTTYWLSKLIREDEVINALATEAFERGYDALADVLLDIDSNQRFGSSDPKIMRVKSDNIKWYLSKRDQTRYGEKVVVENKITADRAIVEALSRGKQRVLEAAKPAVIDAVATELVDISQFT